MDEYRVEHRNHLLYQDGCPYCLRRLKGMIETDAQQIADFCLIHGITNCAEPSCYACGNHAIDEQGRCSDPRCASLNTPEIITLLADFKSAPIELKRYMVGKYLEGRLVGVREE